MTEAKLRADLTVAMKARDGVRTRVLRAVLAAIKNESIARKGEPLAEAEVLAAIKREAKQCTETLGFARDAGRTDTVTEHEAVLAVLEGMLPAQLDEDALSAVVAAIIQETGATAMGAVMKELAVRHPGGYDGKLAATLVRTALG